MYWDQVLIEVLHKNLPRQNYLVTSVNEYNTHEVKAKTSKKEIASTAKNHRQKFYFGPTQPGIYFTLREMQTLEQIIQGKTVPETAKILGMSSRTVEFYVRNMRDKLNCRHKLELLAKIRQSDLDFPTDPHCERNAAIQKTS